MELVPTALSREARYTFYSLTSNVGFYQSQEKTGRRFGGKDVLTRIQGTLSNELSIN